MSQVYDSLKAHGFLCNSDVNMLNSITNSAGDTDNNGKGLLTMTFMNAKSANSYAKSTYNLFLLVIVLVVLAYVAKMTNKK